MLKNLKNLVMVAALVVGALLLVRQYNQPETGKVAIKIRLENRATGTNALLAEVEERKPETWMNDMRTRRISECSMLFLTSGKEYGRWWFINSIGDEQVTLAITNRNGSYRWRVLRFAHRDDFTQIKGHLNKPCRHGTRRA